MEFLDKQPDGGYGSDTLKAAWWAWQEALSSLPQEQESLRHPDDFAVDVFAAAMKAKLAEAQARGSSGWEDKSDCLQQRLCEMLRAHVGKGDPVDVANFACFLWNRQEAILPATAGHPEAQQPEAVEPIGWVFQHAETGRMTFCANDGINTPVGFLRLNPRHKLCRVVYTNPPKPAEAEKGDLLTTYAAEFLEGWLQDESEEVRRHWKRVKEAALRPADQEKGR